MPSTKSLPIELKLAAGIYVVEGCWNLYQELIIVDNHSIDLLVIMLAGVIPLLGARGLLQLRSGWRTYALIICALAIVAVPLAFFTMSLAEFQRELSATHMGLLWLARIYQSWALTRPAVRKLFLQQSAYSNGNDWSL